MSIVTFNHSCHVPMSDGSIKFFEVIPVLKTPVTADASTINPQWLADATNAKFVTVSAPSAAVPAGSATVPAGLNAALQSALS